MPDIELDHITKTFDSGRVVAVDDVSLTIRDGEFVFLLGPSGCGKTTTLRIISGLEKPDRGVVRFDGRDVANLPPWERGIGFVFQHFEIFPHMSVWENAVYGLEVRGFSHEVIVERGEKALSMVGLLPYADDSPMKFGNPGLQRLGLARAIATGARVLVMDEPLGSLDPKVRLNFRLELRRLVKSLGLTALQVTHDQDEALAVGDRIVVMRKGKLLQTDTPERVYKEPNSIFVANFMGEMNFLQGFVFPPGVASSGDDGQVIVQLRTGGPRLRVSLRGVHEAFRVDERVVATVRYEDVHVFPPQFDFDRPENARVRRLLNLFDAEVVSQRFVGTSTRFILRLQNGDEVNAIERRRYKHEFAPRDVATLGIHPNDVKLFRQPTNLERELSLQ